MMHRLRLPLAVCACAVFALPAAALATPGSRGFAATFPVASSLCARVASGHPPARLAAHASQVSAACATLKTSFTNAQNAYTTTVTPLRQQAVTALASLRTTCKAARAAHNPAACRTARVQTRALLATLRPQVRAADRTYHAAVEAARTTFWTTVHALRGGAGVLADRHVGPGPQTSLPSDGSINQA